jgi:hypothetical protein
MSIESVSPKIPPKPEVVVSLAENLIRSYANKGGNVTDLFAAFVGVVAERDDMVGRDCLIALDHWVCGGGASARNVPPSV